jgi:hypothetical protein
VTDKDTLINSYRAHSQTHERDKTPEMDNNFLRGLHAMLGEAINLQYRKRGADGKLGPRKVRFAALAECRKMFDLAVGNEPGGTHWAPASEPLTASERARQRWNLTSQTGLNADLVATTYPGTNEAVHETALVPA